MRAFSFGFQSSVVCVLLAALLGTGCASKRYGEQITTVNYYPQCYAPIQDLRDADASYNTTVVTSSVMGTFLGALAGYLATGKVEGAAAGAAVGLAGGAAMGYASAEQNRNRDDNRQLSSYLAEIDSDITGMDRATAAARVAKKCYDGQFRSAIDTYKKGKMSKDELQQRYDEIKNGSTEVATILGSVVDTANEKEKAYKNAISTEAQRLNRPVPVATAAAKPKASSSARSSKTPSSKATPPQKSAESKPLVSMVEGTERLNAAKQTAADEQKAIYTMQSEMETTLATVMS